MHNRRQSIAGKCNKHPVKQWYLCVYAAQALQIDLSSDLINVKCIGNVDSGPQRLSLSIA